MIKHIAALLLIVVAISILGIGIHSARRDAKSAKMKNMLKMIGVAMSSYQSNGDGDVLAPRRIKLTDSGEGESWRYHIAKYLEAGPIVRKEESHPGFCGDSKTASILALDYPNSPLRRERL